jgi:hypothetical protein
MKIAKEGGLVTAGVIGSSFIRKQLPANIAPHANIVLLIGGGFLMTQKDEMIRNLGTGIFASGATALAMEHIPQLQMNGQNSPLNQVVNGNQPGNQVINGGEDQDVISAQEVDEMEALLSMNIGAALELYDGEIDEEDEDEDEDEDLGDY